MGEVLTQEEPSRQEIRSFVEEGLKDLESGNVYNAEDVFEEMRERYSIDNAAVVYGSFDRPGKKRFY